MPKIIFRGRDAVRCENSDLRLTVLREGGHLAEVYDKQAGVSPLWVPHWASIEPSAYDAVAHPEFGSASDARLLAGIMGHNLCLDLFGSPSVEEQAAGYSAHGEASVVSYDVSEGEDELLLLRAHLPLAQLEIARSIQMFGRFVRIRETVQNLTAVDRPIGWTQHVTLSPPFLDPLRTEFRASMTRSLVCDIDPGANAYLEAGADFAWPMAPGRSSEDFDLRRMHAAPSSGYTAHLADVSHDDAFFVAFSPEYQLAFGYVWKRQEFPWMGIWEENRSRLASPWNGLAVTRGMEFGVSPFPESRREMVERGKLFDTRCFRWLPGGERQVAEYWISSQHATAVPEALEWPSCN